MKNIVLTHTHKQLQYYYLSAVVEGLIAADLAGHGFFIRYDTDVNVATSENNLSVELWKSATKPELGDAVLLHGILINRGEYQMNDVRPEVTIRYIAERVSKFVDEIKQFIRPIDGLIVYNDSTKPPKDKSEELSVDVLIDVDGNREYFSVGHYDYEEDKWEAHSIGLDIDRAHMRWFYLPLAALDKTIS